MKNPIERQHNSTALAGMTGTLLVISAALAAAGPVQTYEFAGIEGAFTQETNGLSLFGEFVLDLNSVGGTNSLVQGLDGPSVTVNFSSAENSIEGSLGAWSFNGGFSIDVRDGPLWLAEGVENPAEDYWIVRAVITGPAVNGWTPSLLNLFHYSGPGDAGGAEVTPPMDPLMDPNPFNFQWNLVLLDEAHNEMLMQGWLTSIQSVPEPSSLTLFLLAVAILARRIKASL